MNKKIVLLLVSFLAFVFLPVAGSANGLVYQVSGIGYNYPEVDTRGSLGLNVNSAALQGWLRYYYPNMNLISTAIAAVTAQGSTVTVTGEATVESVPGYTFSAKIMDTNPDEIEMEIFHPDGSLYFHTGPQKVIKGNFMISAQ